MHSHKECKCVCVCGGGGGGISHRRVYLCQCCKIHRGDYVHVVKKHQGDYKFLAKIMGGGLCLPIQKWTGGGVCPGRGGGYCPSLKYKQSFS